MTCLKLSIKRVERLHVRTALVCTTGTGEKKYLRVSPDEAVWVSPTLVATYDVSSNTSWTVV